jgi:rhodanese-related sulfurtransferase
VEFLLTEGFDRAKITGQAAFDNRASNYTVNYWSTTHYGAGHLPGAVQYTPKSTLALSQELKTLPTDKPVVVYCYTGQTSAFIAAYLQVLGYDAKSLLFGANGMMYDTMVAFNTANPDNKMTVFVEANDVKNYTLVTK